MADVTGAELKAAIVEVEIWQRVDALMRARPEIKAAHAALRQRARDLGVRQEQALQALDEKIRAASAAKQISLKMLEELEKKRSEVKDEIKRLERATDSTSEG